jgi:hypothetical protein
MTNNQHELQAFGDPEETKFLLLMQSIDNARGHMFKASERYRSLPTGGYFSKFAATARLTNTALADTVFHVVCKDQEDSPLEKAQLIAQILTEDDEKRIAHFNNLQTGVEFSPAMLIQQGIVGNITESLEQFGPDPDVAAGVMSEYSGCAQLDFDKFIEAVRQSKNARVLAVANKVGKEALTLSKYTAVGAVSIYLGTRHLRK